MKQKKLLTMLVLLLMAATGAMAQVAITTDLADSYDAKVGSPITLSIEATNAQYYQWYKKLPQGNAMIMGATSPSYTFTPKEAGETKFFCRVIGYNNDLAESKVTIVKATVPQTYSITLQEGTEDEGNWTVPAEAAEGSPVTVTYNGEKKVKSVKAVKKAPADPLAVPMTIEAIAAGTITVSNPKEGMQYSLNGGAKTAVTTSIDVAAGDKVQFYGNGTSITSYDGTNITGSGDGFTCKVYGNIMSLVDEENFATAKTLSANYTFSPLFSNFTTLTDASGLLLPATQLAENCYYSMFSGCSALTAAPELPATQLASGCYYSMFKDCTSLTAAPELPATQLANACYYYMFRGCTALTAAPALPATQLANSCYYSMFQHCTALTAAPALPATQLAADCYNRMFLDCYALTAAPELPATQLATECYYSMFMGCSALTASPVLPAETLVLRCYYRMFYQCSKLATVTCLATSGIGQSNSSTTNWLRNAGTEVQGAKTVYTVGTAEWPTGNNGIPNGWQRMDVDN